MEDLVALQESWKITATTAADSPNDCRWDPAPTHIISPRGHQPETCHCFKYSEPQPVCKAYAIAIFKGKFSEPACRQTKIAEDIHTAWWQHQGGGREIHYVHTFINWKFNTSIQPAKAYKDESVMLSGPH